MGKALAATERALFWALAAAVFAAVCAGLAARAIQRVSENYESQVRNYAIVRVEAPEGPEAMDAALGALERAPHVRAAARVSNERVAEMLESLGAAPVEGQELPQLRLIELDLEQAPADADVDGDLEAALAAVNVTGEIMRSPSASDSHDWTWRARHAALWGAVAFAILIALIVTLASRGFATRRRDMLQVMADLGETRGKAASKVADVAALAGFWAGLVGALAAGAAGLFILMVLRGAAIGDLPQLIVPIDLAPLAGAPLFASVAAAMGARRAAESFYDQAARLG